MIPADITVEYLADRREFLEQLAQSSWKEWQDVYEKRDQTLDDCLKIIESE